MLNFFYFLIFFCILGCCQNQGSVLKHNESQEKNSYDTSFVLFSDSSYLFQFLTFDAPSKNNSIVKVLKKQQKGVFKTIFSDSLNCMSSIIERKDFNNDKIDDILIFHSTGARSNPTYYLYLVNPQKKSIERVYGFEDLPNPDIDSNIITSVAVAGIQYIYNFYMLKGSELINFHKQAIVDMNDSLTYPRIIKQLSRNFSASNGEKYNKNP